MTAVSADWRDEVGAAMRARNLTNHAVAVALNVSPATFASWMSLTTRPAVDKLSDLSRITGITEWRLYSLAGYLPPSYDPSTAMFDAVSRQRSLFRQIQDWSASSLDTAGHTTTSQVVGTLLSHDASLELTVRQNLKGRRFSVAPHTLIKVTPRIETGLDSIKRKIEKDVGIQLASMGALWRNHAIPPEWQRTKGLMLDVPEQERTRQVGADPVRGLPSTFVFLGVPYAHAELAASLVAEAIDYSHINTRSDACASHELNISIDDKTIAQSARQRLLEICTGKTERSENMVQAFARPEVIDDVSMDAILNSPSQLHFIHFATSDCVIDHGAKVWGIPPKLCREMEARLVDLTRKLGSRATTCRIFPPDSSVTDADAPNILADEAVIASGNILDSLHVDRSLWRGYLKDQTDLARDEVRA